MPLRFAYVNRDGWKVDVSDGAGVYDGDRSVGLNRFK
jgi:hypothetical protein